MSDIKIEEAKAGVVGFGLDIKNLVAEPVQENNGYCVISAKASNRRFRTETVPVRILSASDDAIIQQDIDKLENNENGALEQLKKDISPLDLNTFRFSNGQSLIEYVLGSFDHAELSKPNAAYALVNDPSFNINGTANGRSILMEFCRRTFDPTADDTKRNRWIDAASLLIDKGADLHSSAASIDEYDCPLIAALDCANQHNPPTDKDLILITKMLDKGVNINVIITVHGDSSIQARTPLFSAVTSGNLDLVKFLMNHGANKNLQINGESRDVNTPAKWAAYYAKFDPSYAAINAYFNS